MKQLILILFLLTTSYSKSKFFKVDEFGDIVTYPLFKEENQNLTMYMGIEKLKDEKSLMNTLLKIDVESGEKKSFILSPKDGEIDYDIKGNLKEIFYKNQDCVVATVGSSDFSQIVIFDKDLNRLQNILLKWELKDAPIIFDVNSDNLLDMLVQTDEKVYILKQNENTKFELIENDIKNENIKGSYRIFVKHPNPIVIDYESNKYLMLNYSKLNIKTYELEATYIDLYEIKSDGKIEKIKSFKDEDNTNDSTLSVYNSRENHLKYILPIITNGKILIGSFNENSYIKNLLITAKENTLFSNVIQSKVFTNGGSNYYSVLDNAHENLVITNLDSEAKVRVIPNYKPYGDFKTKLNALPLGIDFTILNEKGNIDIYINSKDEKGNLILLEPTNKDIIIDEKFLFDGKHKDTYKYIIGKSNNKTYLIGFGKYLVEVKNINLSQEFANLKYYNEFFSSSNYLYLGYINNLKSFDIFNFSKIFSRVNILTSLTLDKNLEKVKSTLNEYSFIQNKINFFKRDELKDISIESSNLNEFLEKLNEELNLRVEQRLIKELQNSKNIFSIIKQKDEIKNSFFDCKKCVNFSEFLNEFDNFIKINSIYKKEFFDRVNIKIISFLKSGHFFIKEIEEEYKKIQDEEKLKLNIKRSIRYSIIFIFIWLLYLFYKRRKKFIIDTSKHIIVQINVLKLLFQKELSISEILEENFESIFKNIDYIHSTLMYKILTLYANLHVENYYYKISEIFQKRLLTIDINNRILIHNILKATRDKNRKIYNLENDYAFKLSIQLLSILSKLEDYKSFWRVVEQISLYITTKEKVNPFERKEIFLTEINFLKNEKYSLTLYFIQNYKIDEENKYSFQEKSKLLSLLYSFYEENHLSEKIKELNNLTFEKEELFALQDNYIIITPQKDNSILKTFIAFDLKNAKEKAIRYFDNNKDYLIEIDNLFEYKIDNISFVKYDKPIKCKNYVITIEDKSSINTSLYNLVLEETISPFRIKEIIRSLAKFFIELKEKLKDDDKEFDFSPNIFPPHIFYDMESDKIEIISSQLDKLKIDADIVNNENYSQLHSFFQTPEYRSNPKYYAYNLSEYELEKQLVYYLAYLLYFGLNRKYPFRKENKINNDYSVSTIHGVRAKEKLLPFLNKLFSSNITERVNLNDFRENVFNIYFYNINPFYAGTMLNYENKTNRHIFVGREKELKRAVELVISRKDKIIAIQANKRFGKSSFCSYLYYELEKDRKNFVNVFVSGADWQGEESLYYILANAIYQKLLHYSHIFIEPPKKESFVNVNEELNSFKSYIDNITENYKLTCNFIIDEFESYLMKAYKVRNRDYLDSFKSLADILEKFNILIVGSINFKVARKIYNLPIGELLNVDYRLILGLLSFEDTEKLLNNEIIKSDKIEFDKSIVKAIYNISKGHPFFTQIYAKGILNEKNKRGHRGLTLKYEDYKKFIDKYEETLFGEMASLFHEFWKLSTKKEQELINLIISDKEIDRVKYIEEIELLLGDGILGQSKQKFYFEVPIFEKWLKNLLLEEEKNV